MLASTSVTKHRSGVSVLAQSSKVEEAEQIKGPDVAALLDDGAASAFAEEYAAVLTHLTGSWHAVYAAGCVMNQPMSTTIYCHPKDFRFFAIHCAFAFT